MHRIGIRSVWQKSLDINLIMNIRHMKCPGKSGHIDSDITAECIQHDDVEKRYLTAYAVSFYGTGAPDVPAYELRDCDVGPCPV